MAADPAWIAESVDRWNAAWLPHITKHRRPPMAYSNRGRRDEAPKKVLGIVGIVGTEPEWREAGDTDVLEFRLATTQSYEEGAEARWFDVTVWNESLQKSVEDEIFKGAKVAVEGTYSSRDYEGRTYHKINASRVGLVEWLHREKGNGGGSRSSSRRDEEDERPTRRSAAQSSRSSSSRSSSSRGSSRRAETDDTEDDDLPF
jgi:single stranded DNA-binding protein